MVQVAALSNVETHSGTAIPQSAAPWSVQKCPPLCRKVACIAERSKSAKVKAGLTNCALSVIETQTAMGFCLSEFTDQTACGLMIPT
jgi:hypothetical protein